MKNKTTFRTLLVTLGLALAVGAQAAPMIRLSDGTTTVDLGNPSAGFAALDSAGGDLSYGGTFGANWMLNLSSAPGSLNYSLNASNVGGGGTYLDISLSDNNLTLGDLQGLAEFVGNIQGQTQGLVTWWMYVDDGDNLFAQTTEIGNGTNGSNTFNSSFDAIRSVDGTFSMTLLVRINHGNSERLSSVDFSGIAQVFQVPEPATLLLLGAGLFGIALSRRRAH